MGKDTVPMLRALNTSLIPGATAPRINPAAMARKIQRGKKRSNVDMRPTMLPALTGAVRA
jgi:hypothetical protein